MLCRSAIPLRAPKCETRLVFREVFSRFRTLLALDRTAKAAVLLHFISLADGRSRIVASRLENGLAEILRRRHAPLPHQINQGRRAVFGNAKLAENDR